MGKYKWDALFGDCKVVYKTYDTFSIVSKEGLLQADVMYWSLIFEMSGRIWNTSAKYMYLKDLDFKEIKSLYKWCKKKYKPVVKEIRVQQESDYEKAVRILKKEGVIK